MTRINLVFQALLAVLFAAGMVIAVYVDLPGDTALWHEAQNTGHTPLFGGLALVALAFARGLGIAPRASYGWACAVSMAAGVAVELIQWLLLRDADVIDVLRDLLGVGAFLGLYAVLDPRLRPLRLSLQTGLLLGGAALLMASLWPLVTLGVAYAQRDAAFPDIARWDEPWTLTFTAPQEAELSVVAAPATWIEQAGRPIARLGLHIGTYPGLAWREPMADWRGFSTLTLPVYGPGTEAVDLTLRIHDQHHDQTYDDRYNTRLHITPGANRIRIPLDAVRAAPNGRAMDMAHIAGIALFAVDTHTPLTLYVGDLRLE